MLIGQVEQFAIECQIDERTSDRWILGRFRFWAEKESIGNWDDSVDLKGCRYWLKDFIEFPQDRCESGLMDKSKEDVFHLLFDSFMPISNKYRSDLKPPFKNIETRFQISHLGMSSFDRFDILLIEDNEKQRILWRDARDMEMKEAFVPPAEMQNVAKEFCEWFGKQEIIEQSRT